MEINIAVILGDGIGPEITEATEQVLKRVCEIYGHVLNITHVKACSSSIEETGEPLPKESLKKCLQADAVLLGNTGLEKYKNLEYFGGIGSQVGRFSEIKICPS